MKKNTLQKIFNPGPRGKLRWIVFGILILFIVTFFIDIIGFNNRGARFIDSTISSIPVIKSLKVWPKIETNQFDNSKSLKLKSIQEIDLVSYGRPFKLGLDLLGGTHLIYEADTSQVPSSERADALAGVRDVIERRVNTLGVSEPIVQTNQVGESWRVIVELAGVSDVNTAINMIGETPLLEFKEESGEASQLTAEQATKLSDLNKEVENKAQIVLNSVLAGGDFAKLAKENSDDPGSKDNGGLYAGIKKGMFIPEYEDVLFNKLKDGEIYPKLVKSQFGYHIIKRESSKGTGNDEEIDTSQILFATKTPADIGVALSPEWKNTELTGKHLKRASVDIDQRTGIPQVSLEFNSEGTDLFAKITKRNTGKLVAIFLDGEPISIPRVNEPILSGQAVISGSFTIAESKVLAQRLNAGALPVPINLISQTTIGASLGSESVQKSLFAGFWGLVLVAIFMVLYYRLSGVLSVISLLIYTLILLALFKLIPVTLTLAGIAGFILSIGMAIDANVLIFERLKEELRDGKSLPVAVEQGFIRAWSSIRDSNISSLITCAILFWFGSSIIKGFAVTLALGIVVSMFSAITVTKQFLKLVSKWKISKNHWLYGVKSE